IATSLSNNLLYIATMQPFGKEALARINRHMEMRKDKGFESIDCYTNLDKLSCDRSYSAILLECMSNLLANELYQENADTTFVTKKILQGIAQMNAQTQNLIIVSNDISADINNYSVETIDYIKKLGEINSQVGTIANVVVEVVCGIPIYHKGEKVW
ncbi:MAG: bifunctional adenosylcobinamide kinase/adenosylcobinamide-phosphate guanylyltransferase, partial [Oscillospiraceae bacterium]